MVISNTAIGNRYNGSPVALSPASLGKEKLKARGWRDETFWFKVSVKHIEDETWCF